MSEVSEKTILQDGPVRITNQRALIGTLCYPMTDIRSVRVTRRARNMRWLWLVAIGVFLISWSLIDQTGYYHEFFNIGVVLILVGLAVTLMAKPTFALQINGAAGENRILSSTDPAYIQRIAGAMCKAISGKGESV